MANIEKLTKEIEKNTAKIAELKAKNKVLETQKTELENLEIVKLVKSVNIDNAALSAFLKAYAKGDIALPDEYAENTQEQEDADNE